MIANPIKIVWRDEAYGELRGVESAFRIEGETSGDLVNAIQSASYKHHGVRRCWYTYDRAGRLLLEDNIAVLKIARSGK